MQHAVFFAAFFNRPRQRFHILEQGDDFAGLPGGAAFEDSCRPPDRSAGPSSKMTLLSNSVPSRLPFGVIGHIGAFGKALLIGLKAANTVAEDLRQHRETLSGR
jgi:hypothetical protein